MKHTLHVFLLTTLCCFLTQSLHAQDQVPLDWALHDAGQIKQLVTNQGALWTAQTNYPGLLYSEYPPNSFIEHIGEAGLWIGGLRNGDTLASTTTGWNRQFEFYPSSNPADTIYKVTPRDSTSPIPYLPEYQAVSSQDYVMHYNDYNMASLQNSNHDPLYVDVRQSSYSWSSPPLDKMIIYNFKVSSARDSLRKVYITYWMDGNIGYRTEGWDFSFDDLTDYYPERHMGVSMDQPGGPDGTTNRPMAIRIYPPEAYKGELEWGYTWYPDHLREPPPRDQNRYELMSSGTVMSGPTPPSVGSAYIISFGPMNLAPGDTVTFNVAQVMGRGMEAMMNNVDLADFVVEKDFNLPSAPPAPQVSVDASSRSVTLNWGSRAEGYEDPHRSDSVDQPFEGYRVFKSTESSDGPWTLLAEYDISNNEYGQNTGLQHSYTDDGLMNNVEYYYTVTAFSKPDTVLDFPSQESSRDARAQNVVPATTPPDDVGEVAVVPNPYRGDINYNSMNPPWERPPESRERWLEQDRRIQFINLPERCVIRIYTLSGTKVQTLQHNNPDQGFENWNLTSNVGQAVASGIYLYTVKNMENGHTQTGKFVIIK